MPHFDSGEKKKQNKKPNKTLPQPQNKKTNKTKHNHLLPVELKPGSKAVN